MHYPPARTASRIYRINRRAVLKASDICHICRQSGATSVDHVVPYSVALAAGWSPAEADGLGNLAPCCVSCNLSRGNKPLTVIQNDAA